MKRKIFITILLLLLSTSCLLQAVNVSVDDFGGSVTLIGKLGKPLGTVANVEGQMVSEPKMGRSGQITAAFQVTKVDGQRLPKAKTVGLIFRHSQGTPAVHANDIVQLSGYETGAYIGTPDAARDQMGADASPLDWQFESLVHVINAKVVSSP
jgi:hypothetical protein